MAETLIVGGGVVGLGLSMLLARDGHKVTVLERDAEAPPADAETAWSTWARAGVNQFRLPHLFLAGYREIVETELPEVSSALEREGAVRFRPLLDMPESISGGRRPGDERRELLSGRRAMVERVMASQAEATPGVEIRRGCAVTGLVSGPDDLPGTPHVVGVRTEGGEELLADLVVDCGGRRSALPSWLEVIGARPADEVRDDSGFIYYGRHFRSPSGSIPAHLGPGVQDWGSISSLTLPADGGHWSLVIVARADDRALLGLRDSARWETVVRSLPTVAHWLEGAQAVDDRVVTIAKIEDRHRDLWPGGTPVVTGLVSLGDAWSCTNPSLGRGASIGMLHARALRDTLRSAGPEDPSALSEAFREATLRVVEPWWSATHHADRHRLGEMAAIAQGTEYHPDDPLYEVSRAMQASVVQDPDLLRAALDVGFVLEQPDVVAARPGLLERAVALGGDWRSRPPLGPDREALLAMAGR